MKKQVLLVEPSYKNKYPPLGLMKIAQYHKEKGDHVEFTKGLSVDKRDKTEWDRIYVASLFSYDWKLTVKTIKYYRYSVKEPASENLIVGGVMATLMSRDLKQEVNCRVVEGLLDKKGLIGYEDDAIIDCILPDYSILDEIDYKYPMSNAYIGYMTRGCIRKCSFCAVPLIEPVFKPYISLGDQINEIDKRYGAKKDLLLMDNNVLASKQFKNIINEIKAIGFSRGSKLSYTGKNGQSVKANRYVDFNQGVDVRLLNEAKMNLLSQIAIKPLRIAFDDISLEDVYKKRIRLAAQYGINHLSNYVLYNFQDKPEDLYTRLRINLELNQELGLRIYSFPMRYINIMSKERGFNNEGNIGPHWNRKFLRSIQCISNVTHGVVSPNISFFEAAFGKDIKEYMKILTMPEDYIINRKIRDEDGSTEKWWEQLNTLSESEREQALSIIINNEFNCLSTDGFSNKVKAVLTHYMD